MAIALWFGVGCSPKKAGKGTKEPGPTKTTVKEHKPGVPACSFVLDEIGRPIVDLKQCRVLQEDNSIVVLEGTALKRPVYLTHLTDQLYYALDSHCGGNSGKSCTAHATSHAIICPCDSTHYDLSGAVIKGSGTRPLREFPSLKNGDRIRITLQ